MFRTVLSSAVVLLATGGAFAADLPARVAAPAPYLAAPVFTWTGFYVGLNAGAAFNTNRNASVSSIGLDPTRNPIYQGSGTDSGATPFTGGAQVGYNMQFGSFVAGVEADINYLHRDHGANGVFPAPANLSSDYDNRADFAVSSGGNRNWFGTARGKLGFAFDRVLVYGTGGLAFTGRPSYAVTQRDIFETTSFPAPLFIPTASGSFVTNPLRDLPSSSSNGARVGWALGGGVEYAITNAISMKLEYLHIGMRNTSTTFTTLANAPNAPTGTVATGGVTPGGSTITVRSKNDFDVVRAGVNYRF